MLPWGRGRGGGGGRRSRRSRPLPGGWQSWDGLPGRYCDHLPRARGGACLSRSCDHATQHRKLSKADGFATGGCERATRMRLCRHNLDDPCIVLPYCCGRCGHNTGTRGRRRDSGRQRSGRLQQRALCLQVATVAALPVEAASERAVRTGSSFRADDSALTPCDEIAAATEPRSRSSRQTTDWEASRLRAIMDDAC